MSSQVAMQIVLLPLQWCTTNLESNGFRMKMPAHEPKSQITPPFSWQGIYTKNLAELSNAYAPKQPARLAYGIHGLHRFETSWHTIMNFETSRLTC